VVEKTSMTALVREQLESATRTASGPGEATLHVLHGRVRLVAGDVEWEGSAGDLLVVPRERHALDAIEDSAVLLTVGARRSPIA
jgi:quercetin dioxygenase-like cupin family protein